MALEFRDRLVLFIYSAVAFLAIILGAVSIGRIITFQTGASCASGSFSVEFPFLASDFRDICSSVENARGMLEGAVVLFGINGILWPIYFTYWKQGNLDADQMAKIISFAGSIAVIATFYALDLTEKNGKIYSGEDSTTSIERVVNAYSLVAIIGGGFQFALFNFREGQSTLSGGGNMDGGFSYVQM
jgi:hypothetical protein